MFSKAVGLAIVGTTIWSAAFGHEVLTHQNIGDIALQYLYATNPNRPLPLGDSLANFEEVLRIGAAGEDNDPLPGTSAPLSWVLGRFYFHFYPSLSYSDSYISAQGNCNSVQWGLMNSSCPASCTVLLVVCSIPSPFANQYSWSQDLAANPTGQPSAESIQQFGYIVHLLEDLGSPPHTRNDLHACPVSAALSYLGISIRLGPYCSPFEQDNNGATPVMPTTSPAINTTGFTTPTDFFLAMQNYTCSNYFSDNTIFDSSIVCPAGPLGPVPNGPALVTEDSEYFYGACLPATIAYGVCESINGYSSVRKIAAKGYAYWSEYEDMGVYDDTTATIDSTIAHEQFAELGPVISQHVAAFIQFYAPALKVNVTGPGTITSNPGTIDCTSEGGTCAGLFAWANPSTQPQVTLTAVPPAAFMSWSGTANGCTGTTATITLTLTGDGTCTAAFSTASHTITYTNIYGQIGNFGFFIEQGTSEIYSNSYSVNPSNGVFTVNTAPLNLSIGTVYTMGIYTTGATGFGAPFSNYQITLTPDLQFSDGTQTKSGFFQNPTTLELTFVRLE